MPQQGVVSPAIYLVLDRLDAIYLPFDRSGAPQQQDRGTDSIDVPADAFGLSTPVGFQASVAVQNPAT